MKIKRLPIIVFLFTSLCGSAGAWDLSTITDVANLSGVDHVAEKVIIGKFVKAFRKERPISTSIDDAYPRASGIENFRPHPVSRKTMEALRQNGHVLVSPGVHDFYFQSFCLHAGKYSPKTSGTGYLVAPLKGSQSEVVTHILQNYPRFPEVSQHQVQYLLWAIDSGCTFGDLPPESQSVARKILSPEDLKKLGKSFWSVLPRSLRSRLFSEFRSVLPDDLYDTLAMYDNIQHNIAESRYTYQQLERIAVQLGDPPFGSRAEIVEAGTWCDAGKGYYMRVFPSGFSNTRVQIFVPPEGGNIDFNPAEDIGAPGNTGYQRIGNGCAWSGTDEYADESTMEDNAIVENADKWLGTPYELGGDSKDGMDCSHFVYEVLTESGYTIITQTANEYIADTQHFETISEGFQQPGDIICFPKEPNGHIGIVKDSAIFIGSQTSTGVADANYKQGYWGNRDHVFLRVKQ